MSKLYTDTDISNIKSKIATLESSKASSPSTWWDGDRVRAIRVKANLQTNPPTNLTPNSIVAEWRSALDRLGRII